MDENKTKVIYNSAQRKEWKKKAKHVLKTHYVLLIMVALLAGMIGLESGYSIGKADMGSAKTVTVTNAEKAKKVTGNVYKRLKNTSDANIAADEQAEIERTARTEVLENLMKGDLDAGGAVAKQEIEKLKGEDATKAIAARRSGFLAWAVNGLSSGAVMVTAAKGIGSIVESPRIGGAIVVFLVLLIYFLLWFLLVNPYKVMMSRVYMESSVYEVVPIGHLFFLKTIKKWGTVAKSMLRWWIYKALWWLTIVGGVIKYYSYWCVPYILAENPAMSGREAINLSRKMMNGRKWQVFKYDCSFIGWYLLAGLSLGILNIVFVTPYKRCSDVQLYTEIREEAHINHVEGVEKLKDIFLFEKTDPEVLAVKYSDILYREKLAEAAEVKLTGVRYFLVKNFGLWTGSKEEQDQYEAVEVEEVNLSRARLCAEAKAYPERYNPLWNAVAEEKVAGRNNYLKSYSIWSIIAMFAIFAFVGWAWEVGIHVVEDGVFINRGVNHGPWLPIYGAGACMILLFLKRFRKEPAKLAVAAIVLCGLVEYFTSFFLEMSKGIRWWDYTGYFLNLNGRICAEGLMVFAIAGCAAVYVLAPWIDRMLQKVPHKALIGFCVVFMVTFIADTIYSGYYPNTGEGITDYKAYEEAEATE